MSETTTEKDSTTGAARSIEKPIVFFDGVCGLCNASVDFLIRVDRREQFYFAPLQGKTAATMLPPLGADSKAWSVVYYDERGTFERTDAVLQILRRLGGVWWVLSLARIVPRFIRDRLYIFVAHHRYAWFGEKESCRMPTPAERKRFLT